MKQLDQALICSPAFQARNEAPSPALFDLPEKVLQFGTGAFVRGFADYFIDRANRAGQFGGRVVAIGSTGSGRVRALQAQDGAFTLCVQGLVDGVRTEARHVVTAISRALSARDAWADVLACAANPALEVILSNTTEVGLTLDADDAPDLDPPRSFPGKLTAFLHARARAFDYDPTRGVFVLPLELIEDNGDRLRALVGTLAARWKLGEAFAAWLDEACRFCNTLVDRIVPGTPEQDRLQACWHEQGYRDDLLITAEPYRLWAIEGDDALRRRLGFAEADPGIVVTEDITPYRTLKVRILNGSHTVMVPLALLCGLATVREAAEHPLVGRFLRRVLFDEIVPGLEIAPERAQRFAQDVLDRFANPHVRHELRSIMLQATTKMGVRVAPSLRAYAGQAGAAPASLAFGVACYLLLRREETQGRLHVSLPPDDRAAALHAAWQAVAATTPEALRAFAETVCRDEAIWGTRLDEAPGFTEAVAASLAQALREGVPAALAAHLAAVEAT